MVSLAAWDSKGIFSLQFLFSVNSSTLEAFIV